MAEENFTVKCPFCDRMFTREGFVRHKLRCNVVVDACRGLGYCSTCKHKFASDEEFTKHSCVASIQADMKPDECICTKCNVKFPSVKEFGSHPCVEISFVRPPPVEDVVNHPPHYTFGKHEVIDIIKDWGLIEGFALGNAIKYIARAGKKDPGKTLEDLKKARFYIDYMIRHLEEFSK